MSKAFRLLMIGLLLVTLGLASGVAYGQDQGVAIKGPTRIFVEVPRPAGQPAIHIPSNIPPNAPKAATISVTYHDTAGCGWSWGNSATPGTAAYAFEYAAGIWEATLTSAVTIRVDATFSSLPGTQLGGMGPYLRSSWASAPISGVWFAYPIADKFAGSDLDAANPDIIGEFDCDADRSWYFGTDGMTPAGDIDFVTVVLHELAHGVGFLGLGDIQGGLGTVRDTTYDRPSIWDCYTATDDNGTGDYLVNTSVFADHSAALATALTSDNVYFHGAQAMTANANAPVPLYAPAAWAGGSSYSHLAESYNSTANDLMTFSIPSGTSQHTIGPVILGILNDTGWDGSITNGGEACQRPTAVRLQSLTASSATPALVVVGGICAVLLLAAGAVVVRRRS